MMRKMQRIRSRWPGDVLIKKESYFALKDGGEDVGYISLKAGTKLHLIEIKPEHAIVVVADAICPVPVENTDLVDRLGGISGILALPDDPPPAEAASPAHG